jgi:putative methionine-R-sulfoxide reductase with GAF domain
MMADTASAMALPIFFAEQLHGVLYVESSQPIHFSEGGVPFQRCIFMTLDEQRGSLWGLPA